MTNELRRWGGCADADGSAHDRVAYARTLAHVRELVPEALDDADPAAWRTVLFRIHVDEVSGRASSTDPAP